MMTERIDGDTAANRRGEADSAGGGLSGSHSVTTDEGGRKISEEDPSQDQEQDLCAGESSQEEGVHGHAGTEGHHSS